MQMFENHQKLSLKLLLIGFISAILLIGASCEKMCQPCEPYIIMYAFDEEGRFLAGEMTVDRQEKILGRTVHIGQLAGKDIVLVESGVGMTNAAMTAQKMIDMYKPKGLIFTGIAGAIDTVVNIGDIVVCDYWATHDYGYVGADGFVPGRIKVYPPAVDSLVRKTNFEVDKGMFENVQKLVSSGMVFDSIGNHVPKLIVGGVGVSGNTFIDQVEKRLWLSDNFTALTTDMESAAVVQVCFVNDVPSIVFRSASDLAGGSGSESARSEMDRFFKTAAANSAGVVLKFLELLE